MDSITSRRALLGTIGIAPLAVCAITGPAPAATVEGEPGLTAAIQAYRDAKAVTHSYHDHVHHPAYQRWQAAVAKLPHQRTSSSYPAMSGKSLSPSTADDITVATARSFCAKLDAGVRPYTAGENYGRTMRELVSLADARDAETKRLRIACGVDATGSRADELADEQVGLLDVAIAYPVTTVAGLAQKIAFIDETDWWDVDDTLVAIRADVQRLAGRA